MRIEQSDFTPTYQRDGGLWVANIDTIKLPDGFTPKEKAVVYLPPLQFGGNHKHPRTEVMVGLGDLILAWLDENGKKQETPMNPNNKLLIFTLNPFLPHAVFNRSTKNFGIIIEWANESQHDLEMVQVI